MGGSHPPSLQSRKTQKDPLSPAHARLGTQGRESHLSSPFSFLSPFPAASVPPPPIHPSLLSTSSFPFSGHHERLQSSFRCCHRTSSSFSFTIWGFPPFAKALCATKGLNKYLLLLWQIPDPLWRATPRIGAQGPEHRPSECPQPFPSLLYYYTIAKYGELSKASGCPNRKKHENC